MPIKDVIKHITSTHNYKVTGEYWSRVGAMCKRYGEDIVMEAIDKATPDSIPLTQMLNIVEKKCQFILEHGTGAIDELVNEILNSGEDND